MFPWYRCMSFTHSGHICNNELVLVMTCGLFGAYPQPNTCWFTVRWTWRNIDKWLMNPDITFVLKICREKLFLQNCWHLVQAFIMLIRVFTVLTKVTIGSCYCLWLWLSDKAHVCDRCWGLQDPCDCYLGTHTQKYRHKSIECHVIHCQWNCPEIDTMTLLMTTLVQAIGWWNEVHKSITKQIWSPWTADGITQIIISNTVCNHLGESQ